MSSRAASVVIIEDEPVSADALALVLRDWGADVTVGANAKAIADQLGPRLREVGWIITDFNLGDGPNGVTEIGVLTQVAPEAKVLVLSGSMHKQAQNSASRAGYSYMQKPARAENIVSWLEDA
jgi:DNA-binding NtrC family response regulator